LVSSKRLTFAFTDCLGDATGDVTEAGVDSVGTDCVRDWAIALGWSSKENPTTSTRNTAVTIQLVNFFAIGLVIGFSLIMIRD
jgi:hypothetical protein